jgi:hypothetical protein
VPIDAFIYRFYQETILKPRELGVALYLDISKAFDRISRETILFKFIQLAGLMSYG